MAGWTPIQYDFSGGTVALSFINRQDLQAYRRSVLRMENWMPSLTGSAKRTPGSRYMLQIADEVAPARLMPYLSIINERVLVQLTDQTLTVISNTGDVITNVGGGTGSLQLKKQVLANPEFRAGLEDWDFVPDWGPAGAGDELGCRYLGFDGDGALQCVCRNWKYPEIDNESCTVRTVANIDIPTSRLQFAYRVIYQDNPGEGGSDYVARITLGTTAGSDDIGIIDLSDQPVGTIFDTSDYFDLPTDYTGELHVEFFLEATEFFSTPSFFLDRFAAIVNSDSTIEEVELVSPFLADELADVQYVQSPNGNKELVLVHPNHPPQWFYYDPVGDAYVLEPIDFGLTVPGEWTADNYPGVCTAYQGRLNLSGVPSEPESVYGSRVYIWNDMEYTNPTDPDDPSNAYKFVTTFRSPTRWMLGHKDLVVGGLDLEYSVTAQAGFLTAGDIDARVQTTHGGSPVQPVGYGHYVAFAAERGTRLRALQLNRENVGWIAPDKSIMNPDLLRRGIKRLVKMRNPHQMVVCLVADGTLAILHEDTNADVMGWSALNMNASITDITVLPDNNGLDILYAVVVRVVNGVKRTFLEAIVDWADELTWNYLNSHKIYAFDEPTAIITGLEHLEGQRVQVTSQDGFVGNFVVSDGTVTLADGNGNPQYVKTAVVGLSYRSIMVTLPAIVPETVGGLGSQKRYSNIGVRGIFSSSVIINGQRAPERSPFRQMDISQPLDILRDTEVVNLGWDQYATIKIEENAPVRSEIVGIYGDLEATIV